MRHPLRLTIKLALVLVVVATMVIWWFGAPLGRAHLLLDLGLLETAWEVALAQPESDRRDLLLGAIMAAPTEDGRTFWEAVLRARPTVDAEGEEIEPEPWWSGWGPAGAQVGILRREWDATVAAPAAPEREATLARIWDTPVTVGEAVGPYFRWREMDPAWWERRSVRMSDLASEWLNWTDGTPGWCNLGPEAPAIAAAVEELRQLVAEGDLEARGAFVRRMLRTPSSLVWPRTRWDQVVQAYMATEDRMQILEGLTSAWRATAAEPPTPGRDLELVSLLRAGVDEQDSWYERYWQLLASGGCEAPEGPDWMWLGANALRVRDLLEEVERWPLGACRAAFPDPWNAAWLAACQELLDRRQAAQGWVVDGEPGGTIMILGEVTQRLKRRLRDAGLAPHLVALANAAQELGEHETGCPELEDPAVPRWWEQAELIRLGHTPTLDTRGPPRCVHCGHGLEQPAGGLVLHADGRIEWTRDGQEIVVPPFSWRPRIPQGWEPVGKDGRPAILGEGVDTLATWQAVQALLADLPGWPLVACLERLDEEALAYCVATGGAELEVPARMYRAGAAAVARSAIPRAVTGAPGGWELPGGLRRTVGQVAGVWAERLWGDEPAQAREALALLRLGHLPWLEPSEEQREGRQRVICIRCGPEPGPAPGVEVQPDGSLRWRRGETEMVTPPPSGTYAEDLR